MPLIDDITRLLGGGVNAVKSAMAPTMAPEGLAQDRYTHTPIFAEQPDIGGTDALHTGYHDSFAMALHHPMHYLALKSLGMPTNSMIQIPPMQGTKPGSGTEDPANRRHEILHAITLPNLDPNGDTYKKLKGILPPDLIRQVDQRWGDIPHDAIHEAVPYLLSGYNFQWPEYNKLKKSVIDAFPQETKSKIMRLLSAARNTPTSEIGGTYRALGDTNFGPYGPGSGTDKE